MFTDVKFYFGIYETPYCLQERFHGDSGYGMGCDIEETRDRKRILEVFLFIYFL